MNLHQLRYFYDSARLGSTTGAAKVHFITQSAVSQAIRSLEESLGCALIHHRKNAFELTDSGRLIMKECQAIFGAVDNLKANLSRSIGEVSGQLTLASTNSIALTALSPALSGFSKQFPDLSFKLQLGNSDQVKELLRTREAEIGFILEDDEMDGFDSRLIQEGKFLLVSSPRLKRSAPLDKVIVTRQSKVEIRQLQKLLKPGFKVGMEVFSWELIRQLCIDGAGVGYLPEYLVQNDLKQKKLKVVMPELKTWKYKLLAISLKGRVNGQNAQAFLDFAIDLDRK